MASGPGEEIDAAHYDWNWNSPSDASPCWVPAASPMRDSIYRRREPGPLRRHHRRQSLGPGPGLASAHGVHADAGAEKSSALDTIVPANLRKCLPSRATADSRHFRPAGHIHVHHLCSTARPSPPPIPSSPSPAAKAPHPAHLLRSPLRQGQAQGRPRTMWTIARPSASTTASCPTAAPTAPSSRSGGAPGAISTSTSTPATEPLTLESLTANFTAYPFEERASFQSGDRRPRQDLGDQLAHGAARRP